MNFLKKKMKLEVIKTVVLILTIFLLLDCIASGIAIDLYLMRQTALNDLDIPNKEQRIEAYNKIYANEKNIKIIEKFWNDKKMVTTYPNLKITLNDGTSMLVKQLLPDIKPYYYHFEKNKVFSK